MTDLQLFTVQPQLSLQVTDGLEIFVYSRQAINQGQSEKDTLASEQVFDKLSEQLRLKDDIHLMPIGSQKQLLTSVYGRYIGEHSTASRLLSGIDFNQQLLFLRVEPETLPEEFFMSILKQVQEQQNN